MEKEDRQQETYTKSAYGAPEKETERRRLREEMETEHWRVEHWRRACGAPEKKRLVEHRIEFAMEREKERAGEGRDGGGRSLRERWRRERSGRREEMSDLDRAEKETSDCIPNVLGCLLFNLTVLIMSEI